MDQIDYVGLRCYDRDSLRDIARLLKSEGWDINPLDPQEEPTKGYTTYCVYLDSSEPYRPYKIFKKSLKEAMLPFNLKALRCKERFLESSYEESFTIIPKSTKVGGS